jgi:hypothetical protein
VPTYDFLRRDEEYGYPLAFPEHDPELLLYAARMRMLAAFEVNEPVDNTNFGRDGYNSAWRFDVRNFTVHFWVHLLNDPRLPDFATALYARPYRDDQDRQFLPMYIDQFGNAMMALAANLGGQQLPDWYISHSDTARYLQLVDVVRLPS